MAVKATIDDYLARGWIRPSSNSYGAPVIVIGKKTGELRIVIDYRLLNKQTRLYSYPIPHIDELLDRLAHAKYFTKIDLASGHHLIYMADRYEEKTAFLIRYGIYEWLVLPLRLTNAPATFLRLMNRIFHDLLDKSLLIYPDDLLVYSNTDVQPLLAVRYVLLHFCDNQLKSKNIYVTLLPNRWSILGILFQRGRWLWTQLQYRQLRSGLVLQILNNCSHSLASVITIISLLRAISESLPH